MDVIAGSNESYTLTPDMTEEDLLVSEVPKRVREFLKDSPESETEESEDEESENETAQNMGCRVITSRCFLHVEMYDKEHDIDIMGLFTNTAFLFVFTGPKTSR